MTKFSIEYNPYLAQCTFKKNGEILNAESKIGARREVRFQILLGSLENWRGLLEEIAIYCDDDEIELTFKGRKIDYDDLKYTVKLYTGETKFRLVFVEAEKDDANIIADLDKIFAEIKKKNLPEFQEKDKAGKDIFEIYEDVKNGIFEVNVIGTMSSGKSTLINSLLYKELLPAENQACTGTIATILDNDDMDEYEAKCYADDHRTIVHPETIVNAEKMKEYNADEKVTFIDIEGNIPAISSDKIKLCLRDTPGPNNSENKRHEHLTTSIIRRTNAVVLYVMNATQMETDDDKGVLKNIAYEMQLAGKQSRDRFIFVINKCDEIDVETESIEELLGRTRTYLKQFGIIEPTLIPVSAKLALLIRKFRNKEKLTIKETTFLNSHKELFIQYAEYHFEKYATLTPTVREYLQNEVDNFANSGELDLKAIIHSGVPAVEQTVREYVDKYAYPMKIKDAVTDILRILDELNMVEKFDQKAASSNEKLYQVRRQIEEAQRKHGDSESIYIDFKTRINDLQLDGVEADKVLKGVETELEYITRQYNGIGWRDKIEADREINELQVKLMELQRRWEQEINWRIDSQIFKKCNMLLNEYTKLIRNILSDIEIDGYDFRKVNSFEKIRITNLEDIKRRNQSDRFRTETRWKDNPEREGFWGFFKFWEPREVSYTVQVKDGVDINVKKVVLDIMIPFTASINQNINNMFKQADEQISEYKEIFENNINSLHEEITKILYELDARTKQSDALEERVKENRELATWVENEQNKIRMLLTF